MKWARRPTSARDRPSVPAGVIPPLLPTLVDRVPSGDRWLHEIKWDGYRMGVYLDKGKVKVLTRNLHDWTDRFRTIVKAVAALDAVDAMKTARRSSPMRKGFRISHRFSRRLAEAAAPMTSCLPSLIYSSSTVKISAIDR